MRSPTHAVVATALCRRVGGPRAERLDAARRLQTTCASQREFERFRLDMARRPASCTVPLVPDSFAHNNPISANSFHGCATNGRRNLPASAAWKFQIVVISYQSCCAAIEPNWARLSQLLERLQRGAGDQALSHNDQRRDDVPALWQKMYKIPSELRLVPAGFGVCKC